MVENVKVINYRYCMEFKREFGEKVKSLRISLNLTQEQVCEKARIAVQTLSSIETGVNFPSYPVLARLSDALETSPAKLFMFDNEKLTIDDIEAQSEIIEAFKNLDFKKRRMALKIVRLIGSDE